MLSRARVARLPLLARPAARAMSTVNVDIPTEFAVHRLESKPAQTTTTTKEEIMGYFTEMVTMRRMEIVSDNLYKAKFIRGFCHLYDGQEACSTGMEAGLIKGDSLVTAYRDHCQMYKRGGNLKGIISELLGKGTGHSKGKGGSMHLYSSAGDFYGGNGIVGAQCPIGAGIAFKHQYANDGHVAVAMFGDGASNQGQLYEALNMAKLWNLPLIYVCENNHFGMGTSEDRHSNNVEFYKRGDVVPGMRIDGMDVYAVREGIKFAATHCREGKGPMYLELDTYRYHGHSMSDPGSTYRTREDVNKVRSMRDPIERIRQRIIEYGFAEAAELKKIEKTVRKEVDEAVEFAKAADMPPMSSLGEHVYWKDELPIRSSENFNLA